MIELTPAQRDAIAQPNTSPSRVIDPDTDTTYVLIREDLYLRLQSILDGNTDETFLNDLYSHTMEVFGRDGWDDPEMDIYNDLDPRRQ